MSACRSRCRSGCRSRGWCRSWNSSLCCSRKRREVSLLDNRSRAVASALRVTTLLESAIAPATVSAIARALLVSAIVPALLVPLPERS
ncbi:hypothetical protein EJB05_03525, partial [Eragrostis curvula]